MSHGRGDGGGNIHGRFRALVDRCRLVAVHACEYGKGAGRGANSVEIGLVWPTTRLFEN